MVMLLKKEELKGIIPAMLTPFKKDFSVNVEALKQFTQILLEWEVHGLFPTGSIGEAAKLNLKERKLVIKTVIDEAKGRTLVIPGVGFPDYKRTVELIKFVEDIGCDAALIIPPYYQRLSEEALYDYYKSIAESVKDFPLILYNIPMFAGYSLSLKLVERCSETENIIGIKDSSGNIMSFNFMLHALKGKFAILQGIDFLLFPSLVLGSPGGFLGGANIAGKLEVEMYNEFIDRNFEKARSIHDRLVPLWRILSYGTFPVAYKAASSLVTGIDLGPVRKPALPLPEKEMSELKKILTEIGLIEG
jgi:4-hydroxy-tetrahydrodipicolinate synthase